MNINNAIAKAQKLMLDENWNRQVEMGAAAQRGQKMNGGSNDLAGLEEMAFGSSSSSKVEYAPIPENFKMPNQNNFNNGGNIQILQEEPHKLDRSKSKLPKAILESFDKLPAQTGGYMPTATSQLDDFINEQRGYQQYSQPQQVVQPSSNGIDYNYIKYLIDESIKNSMKQQLNESTSMNDLRGMRIGNGGVIQFIDSKGNLYEGKLTLKKRAKQ